MNYIHHILELNIQKHGSVIYFYIHTVNIDTLTNIQNYDWRWTSDNNYYGVNRLNEHKQLMKDINAYRIVNSLSETQMAIILSTYLNNTPYTINLRDYRLLVDMKRSPKLELFHSLRNFIKINFKH